MKLRAKWQQISSSRLDCIKASAVVAICYLFVLAINLAENLAEHLEDYEYLQLDELPFLLLFISFALAWFTQRRVDEKNQEISLRKVAEEMNTQLLRENKALNQHLLKVQEVERMQLARDLHDDIGQYLVAIRLDASTLSTQASSQESYTASRILYNAAHIQKMTKKLMRRLRPAPTNSENCVDAIKQMVEEWQEQSPDTKFSLNISEFTGLLSEEVSVVVYRFIQEAMTNIAKHANATHVAINLMISHELHNQKQHQLLKIEVADNGSGMDVNRLSSGMGIIGMRERISNVNGDFKMESVINQGSTLTAKIPLNKTNVSTSED